ncbi:hypothetical protein QUF80_16620 [Desulfococcaceae bacterium HSG8]|nr:hypothetical protein [Desulfococcaceae bacterium HSG8]
MQNLEFLSARHQEGDIPYFDLNFVIQNKNFREMKAFAELGQQLHADKVRFVPLHNDFQSFLPAEFMAENVCDPRHPDYPELCGILSDPIFQSSMVICPKFENQQILKPD